MAEVKQAAFAAGCFWHVEEIFRHLNGISMTEVGFMGGHMEHPSYEKVCTDTTGHAEAVHMTYNPDVIRYEKLLETFWMGHDPTQMNRQGPDVGTQYRSAIFYYDEEQKRIAEQSLNEMNESGKYASPIVTEIVPAKEFYKAEEYHQQYFEKTGRTCRA